METPTASSWKDRALEFQKKYEGRLEVLFFIGGFIFDALMVSEVDDLFALVQQAVYLAIIGLLLQYEVLFRLHKWHPVGRFTKKIWKFRNLLLHFLLGTLLNIYSLFYIKSASLFNSFIFLLIMVGLIIANESHFVKGSKVSLKIGFYAICLFSYISILYPVILGFVGWTPFALSIATTLAIFYLQVRYLKSRFSDSTPNRVFFFPGLGVLTLFSVFYIFGWIPPVPLSVKEQGIYHMIDKKEGRYLLSTEKVWWKFWQSGDDDFKAEPQDKLYFYSQIYSPARFSDQVFVRWMFKDPKHGWKDSDRIPMKISGGRKEGYRGYAIKSNYQPGQWRIEVETSIGQEISRLNFEVTAVPVNPERTFRVIER
jgi:hypothetical protein